MIAEDVPSPIDLRDPRDAREWERTAQDRTGRAEIFEAFARELAALGKAGPTVLELGSGPGFLAAYLLDKLPTLRLTLLDFSAAMHGLACLRIGAAMNRVHLVERSFKEPGWAHDLGSFDAVITNQAVHELRHKRYAAGLYAEVKGLLRPDCPFLVSDHFFGDGGLSNDRLYMTVSEQRDALASAGFRDVQKIAAAGSLVLHRAN